MKTLQYMAFLSLMVFSSSSFSANWIFRSYGDACSNTIDYNDVASWCGSQSTSYVAYKVEFSNVGTCPLGVDKIGYSCYATHDEPCDSSQDWNQSTGSCDVVCDNNGTGPSCECAIDQIVVNGFCVTPYPCPGGYYVLGLNEEYDCDVPDICPEGQFNYNGECFSPDPPVDPDPDPLPPYTPLDPDGETTESQTDTQSDSTSTSTTTSISVVDGNGETSTTSTTTTTTTGTSSTQETKNRSASGSANCNQRPSCSGDAIDCATLYQVWWAACKEDIDNNASQGDLDQVVSNLDSVGDQALDSASQSVIDSLGENSGISFSSAIGDIVKSIFPSVPCSDYTINWIRPFTLECSKTAIIREFLSYVFSAFVIVTLYNLARERPV